MTNPGSTMPADIAPVTAMGPPKGLKPCRCSKTQEDAEFQQMIAHQVGDAPRDPGND